MPADFTVETIKKPGDLVLGQRDQLFRVGDDGKQHPYVLPHRREQIERAAAFRARLGIN